jgi:hypothetical protein
MKIYEEPEVSVATWIGFLTGGPFDGYKIFREIDRILKGVEECDPNYLGEDKRTEVVCKILNSAKLLMEAHNSLLISNGKAPAHIYPKTPKNGNGRIH